jgi:hypothetical protein
LLDRRLLNAFNEHELRKRDLTRDLGEQRRKDDELFPLLVVGEREQFFTEARRY